MKKSIAVASFVLSFALLAMPTLSMASDTMQELPSLELTTAAGYLSWSSDFVHSRAELRLFGPEGFAHNAELGDGTPMVSLAELEDGAYRWSLLLVAEPSADDRSSLEKGLAVETVAHRFTGEFTISEGSVRLEGEGVAQGFAQGVEKAQVYTEDVIVIGNQCVGSGCEITETIAPDTVRLKSNSIRLHFDDTSTAANHPANDWRITINDAVENGDDYFSINDATAGSQVLRLDAGAPTDALRIVADGDVGLGTSIPGASLHVQRSDGTASLAIEEINATVADRTLLKLTNKGGSKIQMADTSAGGETWFIQNDQNSDGLNFSLLGSGGVEVALSKRQDGGPPGRVTMEVGGGIMALNDNPTVADRRMLHLKNNGGVSIDLTNTDTTSTNVGKSWSIQNHANSGELRISRASSGGVEVRIKDHQDPEGLPTMEVDGSIKATNIVFTSSRTKKSAFAAVDTQDILNRLSAIEIRTWHYKSQDPSIRHMGPVAEDFAAAFALGSSDETISTTDANGVMMAAIQGLHELVQGLQAQNAALQQRLDAIESGIE